MQTFAQHALVGTIMASALGAVALCLVLLLYGFKAEPDDERSPAGRLLLIRLGHALAAACFAVALMLSTVAFLERGTAPAPPPRDDVQRLNARVHALERRLTATESRLAGVSAPGAVVASAPQAEPRPSVVASPARPRKPATTPSRRVSTSPPPGGGGSPAARDADASVIQPVSTQPATPVAATPASSSDDLGVKVREDWRTVKRGFSEAGRDIREGFANLGRRIKHAFD